MRRLDSLAMRVFVLLVLGIVIAAAAAFAVSSMEQRARERIEREVRLVDRVVDAAAILRSSSPAPAPRPDLLGVGPEALRIVNDGRSLGPVDVDLSARLNQRLAGLGAATVSELGDRGCAPSPPTDPGRSPDTGEPPAPPAPPPPPPQPGGGAPNPPVDTCRLVALSLVHGAHILLLAPSGPAPPSPQLPFGLGPLLVVSLIAAVLAWMVAHLITAPVGRLSRAALALGNDLDRPPLRLEGPQEIRKAAAAFNTMQARLRQLMAERTQMLAAITHDLQTPLTRQRLRIDKVQDPDLRDDLLADQEAMLDLIREGLDLARASHDGEERVALEVDTLLDSLVDDAQAAGHSVEVIQHCGRVVHTRPQALSRCLSNLIDNAAKYAGGAELAAESDGRQLVIRVLDRGQGIPAGDLERLFEPFTRGENSRSRETGGAGLGLTIARLLAERSGARLTLHPRSGGGLEARLVLDVVDLPTRHRSARLDRI